MLPLAIVGTHEATRGHAPFEDPGFEIWVFNEAPQADWCRRWDAVFQLHKPEVYTSPHNMIHKGHWAWLCKPHDGKTIWMQDADPRVPGSARYPLDEIVATLPGARIQFASLPDEPHTWFDLSAAYALALALYQGRKEIHIWGMDLVSNTEYTYQLRCWNYWVGVAYGMGTNLVLHCQADAFGSGRLYAYEGEVQIERSLFRERIAFLEDAWTEADRALHRAKDRVSDAILDHKTEKLPDLVKECQNRAIEAGQVSGALSEAQIYAGREDPISRQEFERRSATGQHEAEELRALMYHEGGKVEYVWNVWKQTGQQEAVRQMRLFIGAQMDKAFDMGARAGIYRENLHYMGELDKRITAAGGARTLQALGLVEAEHAYA